MTLIQGTDLVFKLNDYEYRTYLDVEEDNQKIFHHCFANGQEVKLTRDFYNYSPYNLMSPDDFMCYLYDAGLYKIPY